jgi:hypothetical protein
MYRIMVYIGSWFIKYIYTVNNMMMYKESLSLTAGHLLLLGALAVALQNPGHLHNTERRWGIDPLPETLDNPTRTFEDGGSITRGNWMLESATCRSKEEEDHDLAVRSRRRRPGPGVSTHERGTIYDGAGSIAAARGVAPKNTDAKPPVGSHIWQP